MKFLAIALLGLLGTVEALKSAKHIRSNHRDDVVNFILLKAASFAKADTNGNGKISIS